MNINLTLVLPEVFDVVHVILAGLSVVLLVIVGCLAARGSNSSADASVTTEGEDMALLAQPAATTLKDMDGEGALHLLSLFQSEGRLVDFIQEDVAQFSDDEIGAAARVVHKGLKKTFEEHFTAEPVLAHEEGDAVTVEEGFQPQEIQLLGQVASAGPFKGTLVHQGWRVTDIRLPQTVEGRDSRILAAAQVEM